MKPIILDNQGETFDRYTIITPDGEVYGASVDPFHPQGFGQYCGHSIELCYKQGARLFLKKDGTWLKSESARCIRTLSNDFIKRGKKRVKIKNLPVPVQNYISQLVNAQNTAQ